MARRNKRKRRTTNPFELMGKRMTLSMNVMKGKMHESMVGMKYAMSGHEVKKIHKGGDFEVRKTSLTGRKGKPIIVEAKSGEPKLSKAQKRTKRKMGKRYRVE